MQPNTIFLAGREKKCQNKMQRMAERRLLKSERDGEKEKTQPEMLIKPPSCHPLTHSLRMSQSHRKGIQAQMIPHIA